MKRRNARAPYPIGTVTRCAAIAVLAAVAAGCWSGDSRTEPAVSPTPSAEPAPAIPRYQPADDEFCEQARVHEVPSDFGLVVPPLDFSGSAGEEPDRWWVANCAFETDIDDEGLLTRGSVHVAVFEDPAGPGRFFRSETEYMADRALTTPAPGAAGWWDESAYVETIKADSIYRDKLLALDYYIYHDNLYIHVIMGTDFWEEEAEEEVVPLAREIAVALVERAAAHVPLNPNR